MFYISYVLFEKEKTFRLDNKTGQQTEFMVKESNSL